MKFETRFSFSFLKLFFLERDFVLRINVIFLFFSMVEFSRRNMKISLHRLWMDSFLQI